LTHVLQDGAEIVLGGDVIGLLSENSAVDLLGFGEAARMVMG
jgi:hypothetical protein